MRLTPSSADQWNAWVHADLLERRVVHLSGELDDIAASNLCAQLMTLDADGDEAVHLQVNAAGGTLSAAVAMVDTIELLGVPVEATCTGRADGVAALVFATCDRRVVSARATLRLSEPASSWSGPQRELARWSEVLDSQRAGLVTRVAERSGRPFEEIDELLRRGAFLPAEEAVAAGLADEVAAPSARILQFPRQVGFRQRD